jgi:hypothetical protein
MKKKSTARYPVVDDLLDRLPIRERLAEVECQDHQRSDATETIKYDIVILGRRDRSGSGYSGSSVHRAVRVFAFPK